MPPSRPLTRRAPGGGGTSFDAHAAVCAALHSEVGLRDSRGPGERKKKPSEIVARAPFFSSNVLIAKFGIDLAENDPSKVLPT